MITVNKKVQDLLAYEFNNKIHNQKQIDILANSIKEFGFNTPVVIDRQNVIIAGHGRVEALKKLGIQDVPCVVKEDLTEIQIKKYRLLDNKISDLAEDNIENINIEIEDIGDLELIELYKINPEDLEDLNSSDKGKENYTRKVEVPIYEPNKEKPAIADVFDNKRQKAIQEKIEKSNIPSDIKDFLILASYRHTVFDYGKIADFYANSDSDIKDLMEDSALVIIDFDKAIEKGFIKLTDEVADLYNTKEDEE